MLEEEQDQKINYIHFRDGKPRILFKSTIRKIEFLLPKRYGAMGCDGVVRKGYFHSIRFSLRNLGPQVIPIFSIQIQTCANFNIP